jgi:microcystin-dependent protein
VPTATITLGNLSQAYTGSARTPSATTVPSGLSVAFTYNGSSTAPVTVGSYPVVATISDTNYVGTASGTLVITKGTASISLGNVFQSYDGTARRVVAVTEPPGLSWTATYNGSANAPTNLGIYNVIATISDANYMGFTNGVLNVKAGNPGARPDPTAQPPAYLNHHGYLTDASGNPLGSPNPRNYDLVFRIFSAPSGGASLWAESQVVTIDQGEYDVMLGEGMSQGVEPWPALDAVLASGTGSARYLEVTVRSIGIGGSDLTISPRLVLPSQPYAFLARHAQEAQTLTSPDGSRLLQVTGTTVGVGIGDRLANATLDVGGGLTVESLVSRGNSSVGGTYSASLFTGDGTIPIGGIVVWSGGDIPEGWAICDGRTVNGRRTPNLQSRFVLGTSSKYAYGTAGGSERHVLREEHLPSHTHLFDPPPTTTNPSQHHSHTFQTHSAGPRDAFGAGGDRTSSDPLATRTAAAERSTAHSPHNHSGRLTVSGGSSRVGGGQSHNGMPPFYVLAYIMRVQ